MIVQDYSSAIFDLLVKQRGDEAVFASLQSLLKKKGHEKLYPHILKDLLKKFEKNAKQTSTKVFVRREKDAQSLESSILKAVATLSTDTNFTTQVDPTLIGGFKVVGQDKVIDQSYKKQLLAVYRSLIA